MKKGLGFAIPGLAAGGAVTAAVLTGSHDQPTGWALFLWPSLVALAFLAGAVAVTLFGKFRWLWPLGAGFIVQGIGIIRIWKEYSDSPWQALWWTLGAVGIVLFVMLLVWLVVAIQARLTERRMLGPDRGEDIGKIRSNLSDALDKLRKAGGRNAVYELPWFLVIGRPAVGKTEAIKRSGLGLARKDWVKGVGGTLTLNFFFTQDLIFLDTPGKWVQDVDREQEQQNWLELPRLLRKYRGRRPLDGIVAAVSSDDLLTLSDDGLRDQASRVREVIDLLYQETQFRFPIYLLITKCDLTEGFFEFFKGLQAQRRDEIFGWSNAEPDEVGADVAVPKAFRGILKRLEAFRLEMLGRINSATRARRIYFFIEEFKRLERPLVIYTRELFGGDRLQEGPAFRGFYFTSSLQGEGTPLSQAMAELVHGLGVKGAPPAPAPATATTEVESGRGAYFLRRLFRDLLVEDDGLVGRTAVHWWKQRRNTFFGAFFPATLALGFFAMSAISFVVNRVTFDSAAKNVADTLGQLRELQPHQNFDDISKALALTDGLLDEHRRITQWGPFRTWGMNQHSELSAHTLEQFRQQFRTLVLDPTMTSAKEIVSDPDGDCTNKIKVLRAVAVLRSNYRTELKGNELEGLAVVWRAPGDAPDERERIRRQFKYLLRESEDDAKAELLEGFSLSDAAKGIKATCSGQSGASAFANFRELQDRCMGAQDNLAFEGCYADLSKQVINWKAEDVDALRDSVKALKRDLKGLSDAGENDATSASTTLGALSVGKSEAADKCTGTFDKDVRPRIQALVQQDKLIGACKNALAGGSGNAVALYSRALKDNSGELDRFQKDLSTAAETFNASCQSDEFQGVNVPLVRRIGENHWRIQCIGRVPMVRPRQSGTTPAPPTARRREDPPDQVSGMKWLSSGSVGPNSKPSKWKEKRSDWTQTLGAEVGLTPAQKDDELRRVRAEVKVYAQGYADVWRKYLKGLRVQDRPGNMAAADWLGELAKSGEYERVLRPAVTALSITDPEDPFSEMEEAVAALAGIRRFVDEDLKQYRAYLLAVADDLNNPAALARYRKSFDASKLKEAIAWAATHAGPENLLGEFLEKPLREAKSAVFGPGALETLWGETVEAYDAVQGSYLISPSGEGSMAAEDLLVALLGGANGTVPETLRSPIVGELPSAAQDWLKRASRLSELLFAKGQDTPRPIKLTLVIEDASFDPTDLAEDMSLSAFKLNLGSTGSEFAWEADQPRTKSVSVHIIGDSASSNAFASVVLGVKKGGLRNRDAKIPTPLRAIQESGDLAFAKLLASGTSEGNLVGFQNNSTVSFTFPVEIEKKIKGKVTVPVKVDSPDLKRLIEFATNGLGPPPKIDSE